MAYDALKYNSENLRFNLQTNIDETVLGLDSDFDYIRNKKNAVIDHYQHIRNWHKAIHDAIKERRDRDLIETDEETKKYFHNTSIATKNRNVERRKDSQSRVQHYKNQQSQNGKNADNGQNKLSQSGVQHQERLNRQNQTGHGKTNKPTPKAIGAAQLATGNEIDLNSNSSNKGVISNNASHIHGQIVDNLRHMSPVFEEDETTYSEDEDKDEEINANKNTLNRQGTADILFNDVDTNDDLSTKETKDVKIVIREQKLLPDYDDETTWSDSGSTEMQPKSPTSEDGEEVVTWNIDAEIHKMNITRPFHRPHISQFEETTRATAENSAENSTSRSDTIFINSRESRGDLFDPLNEHHKNEKLNARLMHEREILNEIVRILLIASIDQHPNNRQEAAIKFLVRRDRDDNQPFEKYARRVWYLENKKKMERIFYDPVENGYDSPIFSDPRTMIAINMMWEKRVRPHFLFKSFFMMTLYVILLIWITVRLGARNDRQVPAVRRAIHQKFLDPEWDDYNAETYMDIESKNEW